MAVYRDITIDLADIAKSAKYKKEENQAFKRFLQGQNHRKLSLKLKELHEDVVGKVDCTSCGNCCRKLQPRISKEGVLKLANRFNMAPHQVMDLYTELIHGERYLKNSAVRVSCQ